MAIYLVTPVFGLFDTKARENRPTLEPCQWQVDRSKAAVFPVCALSVPNLCLGCAQRFRQRSPKKSNVSIGLVPGRTPYTERPLKSAILSKWGHSAFRHNG